VLNCEFVKRCTENKKCVLDAKLMVKFGLIFRTKKSGEGGNGAKRLRTADSKGVMPGERCLGDNCPGPVSM